MQTLAGISILCILCVGYTYGQAEEFLGILDFDAYGLDLREEDFLKDTDIFRDDTDLQPTDRITEEAIRRLCDEYDIFLDNQGLDCSKIKLVQKALKTEHNLQKRDADDAPLEGSGDGGDVGNNAPELSPKEEEEEEEPIPPQETATDTPDDAPPAEIKEAEVQPGEEIKEEPKELESEPEEAVTEATAIEENAVAPEVPKEPPVVDEAEKEPETVTEGIQPAVEKPKEPSETTADSPAVEENPVTSESVKENKNEPPLPVEGGVEEPKPEITDSAANEEATTVTGVVKKGRKLLPGDIETGKSNQPETDKTHETSHGDEKKESEKLNEQQSGNAVVEGANGKSLEQYEQGVNAMAPNAKINTASADGDEPKSGESAKEAEGGRKDTKVLIILFVAVVVIGGAAFAYNFIKKRKQKKDQVAREENGDGNAVKRSLQNLSGQAKADPEQGTELKPLMKPVVAEYKDEKETTNTEANK